jgi:hypothetical protein
MRRKISPLRNKPRPLASLKFPKQALYKRRLALKKKLWLIWKLGENCGKCGKNFMPEILKGFTKTKLPFDSEVEWLIDTGVTVQMLKGIHADHPKNDRSYTKGITGLSWPDLKREARKIRLTCASCNDLGTGGALHKT